MVAGYRKAAKRTPAKPRPSMGSRIPASDEPVLEPLVDPELVAVEPEPAVEPGLLLLPEGLPVLTVPFLRPRYLWPLKVQRQGWSLHLWLAL